MTTRAALLCALLVAAPVRAQSVDLAVRAMRSEWGMTTNSLRKAVEQMPEADLGYKPTESVRTFREMIKHITATQLVLCGVALGERTMTDGVETAAMTKAEVTRELVASMEFCSKAYDQDLTKVADAAQRENRYYALAHNTAHNGEHYGNIVTYMRMKGLVPPSSQR